MRFGYENDGIAKIKRLARRYGENSIGLNVRVGGPKKGVTVTFPSAVVDEFLLREYDAEKVPHEMLWARVSDVLHESEFGPWLTPLDPDRMEWDSVVLTKATKRWRSFVDYTYSNTISRGFLDKIRRDHWVEYLDAPVGERWEVRTCHETCVGEGPRVVMSIRPDMYHRVTRLRLRRVFSTS